MTGRHFPFRRPVWPSRPAGVVVASDGPDLRAWTVGQSFAQNRCGYAVDLATGCLDEHEWRTPEDVLRSRPPRNTTVISREQRAVIEDVTRRVVRSDGASSRFRVFSQIEQRRAMLVDVPFVALDGPSSANRHSPVGGVSGTA